MRVAGVFRARLRLLALASRPPRSLLPQGFPGRRWCPFRLPASADLTATEIMPAKSRRASTSSRESRLMPTLSKYRSISGSASEMRATTPVSPSRQTESWRASRRRHVAVGGGNRVAVRIAGGMPELGVDAGQHPVGHGVLEHLGLVVHLVPAVAELADQEGLHQPVAAHHRQRGRPAGVGQRHRAVLLVIDEPLIGQLADGLRRGARGHADPLGQHLGADLFQRPLLGGPDHFQIVLGDHRQVARVTVRTHDYKV